MAAETVTPKDAQEQIDDMLDHLYQVEEGARIWRSLVEDEPLRGALYDIQRDAFGLGDRVAKLSLLTPTAEQTEDTQETLAKMCDDLHNYLDGKYGGRH